MSVAVVVLGDAAELVDALGDHDAGATVVDVSSPGPIGMETDAVPGLWCSAAEVRSSGRGFPWTAGLVLSKGADADGVAATAQAAGVAVTRVEDIEQARWEGASWRLLREGIATLTGLSVREVGRREELHALVRDVAAECREVAGAAGVSVRADLAKVFIDTSASAPRGRRALCAVAREQGTPFAASLTGVAVAHAAEALGVLAPRSAALVALLAAASPVPRVQVPVPSLPRVWCAPTSDLSDAEVRH